LPVDNVANTFNSDGYLGAFMARGKLINLSQGANIEFRTFCPKLFTSGHVKVKNYAVATPVT